MRLNLLRFVRRRGLLLPRSGQFVGRFRTRDSGTTFAFTMPFGFPGDVSRGHPASIEPALIDASAPPTAYGQAVITDATTNGVRPFAAGDTAVTVIWGITVRPYPNQQQSTTNYGSVGFGAGTPPTSGAIDILRAGYIMGTTLPAGSAAVTKGSAVYVWCAANSGAHIQGGFETASSGGNTASLDVNRYQFNGPADSNGNAEICCNI